VRIGLVACVKKKHSEPTKARLLYNSDLFRKSAMYAAEAYDAWYILSAEYGLLDPERVIEPYDKTLNTMAFTEREAWAEKVYQQMEGEGLIGQGHEFYIHAGMKYREFLERRIKVQVPLKGLAIGEQLQWYKERLGQGVG
jgi:hypothetical protein